MAKLERFIGFYGHGGTPEPLAIDDHDAKHIMRPLWSVVPSFQGNDLTLAGRLEASAWRSLKNGGVDQFRVDNAYHFWETCSCVASIFLALALLVS